MILRLSAGRNSARSTREGVGETNESHGYDATTRLIADPCLESRLFHRFAVLFAHQPSHCQALTASPSKRDGLSSVPRPTRASYNLPRLSNSYLAGTCNFEARIPLLVSHCQAHSVLGETVALLQRVDRSMPKHFCGGGSLKDADGAYQIPDSLRNRHSIVLSDGGSLRSR